MRALAVIDGEHYAPVVRDALAALPYDFVGALLVGGTEKLRGAEDYGVPLVDSLDAVAADVVVDLSDEPVLSPGDRFRLASRTLVLGMAYVGADFRFETPQFEPFELPSLAVIVTTAPAARCARVVTGGASGHDLIPVLKMTGSVLLLYGGLLGAALSL